MKFRLQDTDGTFVEFNPEAGTTKWKMAGTSMRDFLCCVGIEGHGVITNIVFSKVHKDGSRYTDLLDINQQRQLWRRLVHHGYKQVDARETTTCHCCQGRGWLNNKLDTCPYCEGTGSLLA